MVRETIVEKASIPLQSGETLDAYMRKISDAVSAKFGKPSTVGKSDGIWCWTRAIFKDNAVYESNPANGTRKLFQVDYSVNDDGSVKLGSPTEVREVTSFEPVESASKVVVKRAPDFWTGLPIVR
jgi:hypothetical protein